MSLQKMRILNLFCTLLVPFSLSAGTELVEDMKIRVDGKLFSVKPPEVIAVKQEKHDYFPVFNPKKVWYLSGTSPRENTFGTLVGMTVRQTPDGASAEEGKDYLLSRKDNRIGRSPGSKLKPPVYLSYEFHGQRLDSVIKNASGELEYRSGFPAGLMPHMPELRPGEQRIVNIYLPPGCKKLTSKNLYPIDEKNVSSNKEVADELLPRTLKKLRNGETLKILAWGDSVTEGYRKLNSRDRWQEQFVRRLEERFPKAKIELITNAWGGHNTSQFMSAPKSDSRHYYPDSLLRGNPDLIISEFVNDSWHDAKTFDRIYPRLLKDFRAANAEWIVIAPHHIKGISNVDGNDSRPYVRMLRKFAKTNRIALADVSDRYSRLHNAGIPFLTLMVNDYNHPDARGMKIYADTLMDLFPAKPEKE